MITWTPWEPVPELNNVVQGRWKIELTATASARIDGYWDPATECKIRYRADAKAELLEKLFELVKMVSEDAADDLSTGDTPSTYDFPKLRPNTKPKDLPVPPPTPEEMQVMNDVFNRAFRQAQEDIRINAAADNPPNPAPENIHVDEERGIGANPAPAAEYAVQFGWQAAPNRPARPANQPRADNFAQQYAGQWIVLNPPVGAGTVNHFFRNAPVEGVIRNIEIAEET